MKLPETGEANSTMATREGCVCGGVVLVGFQAKNREPGMRVIRITFWV